MQFRIYSPRLNYFTTITKDEAKELQAHYQVEYEKALTQSVKFIDVSSCTDCMNCAGNPETVVWLP